MNASKIHFHALLSALAETLTDDNLERLMRLSIRQTTGMLFTLALLGIGAGLSAEEPDVATLKPVGEGWTGLINGKISRRVDGSAPSSGSWKRAC